MKEEETNIRNQKYEHYYIEDLDAKIENSELYVYTSSYIPFHIKSSKIKIH